MIYPKYLSGYHDISFMFLPKSYQEYFIRLYYFVNTDDTKIPDTIPVENIENFIIDNLQSTHLFEAKGFSSAKDCESLKNNNYFYNDAQFYKVLIYVCRLWYQKAIESNWITKDCSKEEFEGCCPFLRNHRPTL